MVLACQFCGLPLDTGEAMACRRCRQRVSRNRRDGRGRDGETSAKRLHEEIEQRLCREALAAGEDMTEEAWDLMCTTVAGRIGNYK
jgi:hypothetical protein